MMGLDREVNVLLNTFDSVRKSYSDTKMVDRIMKFAESGDASPYLYPVTPDMPLED